MADSTRQKLLKLEKEGNFVFHGSAKEISELEPRQSYNRDKKSGKMVEHGEPAVAATPYADIAIFRAIFSDANFPEKAKWNWSRFGIDGQKIFFQTSPEAFAKAKGCHGYVYVLPKEIFTKFLGFEWRSKLSIKPFETVGISFKDLPSGIELLEEMPGS